MTVRCGFLKAAGGLFSRYRKKIRDGRNLKTVLENDIFMCPFVCWTFHNLEILRPLDECRDGRSLLA